MAHTQVNFDALYGSLNSTVNPVGDVEPPDQGLCVGPTGEIELVNDVAGFYDRAGNQLAAPISLDQYFNEPAMFELPNTDLVLNFPTDPRCVYDASTNTYFSSMLMLALQFDPTGTQFLGYYLRSHLDLAVNTSGNPAGPSNVYRVDVTDDGAPGTSTGAGCPCYGDQPLIGLDGRAVYLSTNEFSNPDLSFAFNGAHVYAFDKAELLSGSPTNYALFDNLSIGGSIAASIQPAVNATDPGAELFLNSLDPNATVDNRLGVWAVTNESALDSAHAPTLTSTLIQSEEYGQPPVATQKSAPGVTLNTDDDRMQQVQYRNGALWSSLDTAINVHGDTATRSGAAWFAVTPQLGSGGITGASIAQQGYVAVKGAYLLYPAVGVTADGTEAMVATLSGDGYYPSAVYTTRHGNGAFRALAVAGAGLQPEAGFTCLPQYGGPPCRWGDYSAVAWDPSSLSGSTNGNNLGIWMATEYVANDPNDGFLNYSTRVFEV